jgi:hypothetical protein
VSIERTYTAPVPWRWAATQVTLRPDSARVWFGSKGYGKGNHPPAGGAAHIPPAVNVQVHQARGLRMQPPGPLHVQPGDDVQNPAFGLIPVHVAPAGHGGVAPEGDGGEMAPADMDEGDGDMDPAGGDEKEWEGREPEE